MKRYRNAKGELTRSIKEIEKETLAEARKYYRLGSIYFNNADKREYVLIENDKMLAHFKSFEGYNLFIPVASLGTFLPDVATTGEELLLVE